MQGIFNRNKHFHLLAAAGLTLAWSLGGSLENLTAADWPEGVRDIRFVSGGDGTDQPALFFGVQGSEPRPLIVFLHQWGGDYKYLGGRPIARWCVAEKWNFIQPDFRGPNVRPEAMGSDLALADIESAVAYAKKNAPVDSSRIFVVGASGGGHAALLAASRMPGVFKGASVWVPISDLVAWHEQCLNTPHASYSKNIEAACGGKLAKGSNAEKQAIARSPLTYLNPEVETMFDINAGINDGHEKAAVPISHSFHAYNALVREEARVKDEIVTMMTKERKVPDEMKFTKVDASYKDRSVLFRREADRSRLTIFDGAHEMIASAALAWVESTAFPAEAVKQ